MRKKILASEIAIIIPIYKPKLSQFEEKSLAQCFRILNKYDIKLITPGNINLDKIYKIAIDNGIVITTEQFDKTYFESTFTYNSLLVSYFFYKRFVDYEFILIYQLDAYVFRDELEYWINLPFDYIGAPWFENFDKAEANSPIIGVGNGGFSLRRVKSFLHLWTHKVSYSKKKLFNKYYKQVYLNSGIIKKLLIQCYLVIRALGYKNNFNYWAKLNRGNEDVFWSFEVPKICNKFKVADVNTAMKFSYEKNPELLYKWNNNKLPFGCHGWYRYSKDFWKKFIQVIA